MATNYPAPSLGPVCIAFPASLSKEKSMYIYIFYSRLYDTDNSGTINLAEISEVMETMSQVEGRSNILVQEESGELKSVSKLAEEIFGKLDKDKDRELTMSEFVQGYLRLSGHSEGGGGGGTAGGGRIRNGSKKGSSRRTGSRKQY